MAISRSSYNNKAFYAMSLLSVLLVIQRGVAFEFKVGGSSGWSVPSDAQSYNQWAQKNRFQIGDTLLFEYSADKDSVLQVSQDHYTNCITDEPLAKFTNGHTVFKLDQSGPFFFISGTKANCLKNEKLHVIVLADRSGNKSSPSPSPSPSPTPFPIPIPAPSPAPVPSGDEIPSPPAESIPSPPPEESTPSPAESTPSPATSDEGQAQAQHKNGASPLVVSGVGLFGAFMGLSIILGF